MDGRLDVSGGTAWPKWVLGVAGAGLLGWLVHSALGRSEVNEEGSAPSLPGAKTPDAKPVLEREGLTQPIASALESETVEPPTGWRACLELPEAEFLACIAGAGELRLTPEELVALYRRYGRQDARFNFLFREAVRLQPPGEVMAFIDACWCEDDGALEMQYVIENCFSALMQSHTDWTRAAAFGVRPEHLFDAAATVGPVLAARMLADQSSDVARLLQEGARGEWGGSSDQMMRALHASTGLLLPNPTAAFEFLRSVTRASTLPNDPFFGGSLVMMLGILNEHSNAHSEASCALIREVLHDARYSQQAARQINGMYAEQPPRGVSIELWAPVRVQVRQILKLPD